jgi:broad specificity polyphosphatase/5'/3'-nucleotidase SurE
MQDVPAIAVSLDNYLARTEEQYDAAAQYTVVLMKAVLGMLPPLPRQPSSSIASSSSSGAAAAAASFSAARFAGHVLNVNVPKGSAADVLGYCLAHQGQHCHFPDFRVGGAAGVGCCPLIAAADCCPSLLSLTAAVDCP